jgi:hypothetical protein
LCLCVGVVRVAAPGGVGQPEEQRRVGAGVAAEEGRLEREVLGDDCVDVWDFGEGNVPF